MTVEHGESPRQRLQEALSELPLEQQDLVRDQLFAVAVEYDQTKQVEPVTHFLESLVMTARLHRNPAYRKSLSEADEAARSAPEPFDVASRFRTLREQLA